MKQVIGFSLIAALFIGTIARPDAVTGITGAANNAGSAVNSPAEAAMNKVTGSLPMNPLNSAQSGMAVVPTAISTGESMGSGVKSMFDSIFG